MIVKPTRRDALKYGAAAGLAAAAGAPARARPKRGGVMRVAKGHGATSDTLDPAAFTGNFMTAHSFIVGNLLTEVRADGEIHPELAESWEASDDARIWTFRLRPGVTFHDGRAITAADVVASINHHRGEDSASAAKPQVEPIVELTAPNDRTVAFTLANGDADFPYTLADYHLIVCPAAEDGSIDWRAGVGTGPYKLERFEPGVSARYVRNEAYFKTDRAWFDAIEMLVIVDPTARTNALITGEVDAVDRVPNAVAGRVAASPNVVLQEVAGAQHYVFCMNTAVDPFSQNHVRQALKLGIDREELVEKILFGYGVVGNDHPIGRGQRFFNDALAQRSYDPDKARWHLEQAGLDGLSVDLHVAEAAFAGAVDAAALFSETARAAGIELRAVREPNDGYWSDVWMKEPFSASYWSGRPTADQMFSSAYAEGAPWNETFWSNERFNALLVEARAELDANRRRDMYHEMQAICSDEGGAIIPMFASFVFAHAPNVAYDALASNWDMDGEKWAERWWFA